jgi:hypothetical protein
MGPISEYGPHLEPHICSCGLPHRRRTCHVLSIHIEAESNQPVVGPARRSIGRPARVLLDEGEPSSTRSARLGLRADDSPRSSRSRGRKNFRLRVDASSMSQSGPLGGDSLHGWRTRFAALSRSGRPLRDIQLRGDRPGTPALHLQAWLPVQKAPSSQSPTAKPSTSPCPSAATPGLAVGGVEEHVGKGLLGQRPVACQHLRVELLRSVLVSDRNRHAQHSRRHRHARLDRAAGGSHRPPQ